MATAQGIRSPGDGHDDDGSVGAEILPLLYIPHDRRKETGTAIDNEVEENNDDGGIGGGGGRGVFRYFYESIHRPPCLVVIPTHFYKVISVVNDVGESDDDVPSDSGSLSGMGKGFGPDAMTLKKT
jgi:hypothetical protein